MGSCVSMPNNIMPPKAPKKKTVRTDSDKDYIAESCGEHSESSELSVAETVIVPVLNQHGYSLKDDLKNWNIEARYDQRVDTYYINARNIEVDIQVSKGRLCACIYKLTILIAIFTPKNLEDLWNQKIVHDLSPSFLSSSTKGVLSVRDILSKNGLKIERIGETA